MTRRMQNLSKLALVVIVATLLIGCAETDPYTRLAPAPTPEMKPATAGSAFNQRWAERFKCVQTVTIDFRVQTMTLVGYLIVQGDAFRLQGMTEQGLKLFDIAYRDGETRTIFAGDEFNESIIENISRDIRRVFVERVAGAPDHVPDIHWDMDADETGTRAKYQKDESEFPIHFVGEPPRVDWYELNRDDRNLYRVGHYEWAQFGDEFIPSVVVLRERGVISDGPYYKLTIKLTEFKTRDEPWPQSVFNPPEDE